MNRIERIPVQIAVKALRNGADPAQVAEFLQAVVDVEEDLEKVSGASIVTFSEDLTESARDAFYAALDKPPTILQGPEQ